VDAALQRLPDGRVRVHAKVVRLPDFRILWAQDYELAYDVLALRGADLARELAQRLVEMARHRPPATNTAATDLALSAGSALTQGTPAAVERAVQQLQEAVAGDPDDAGVRGLLARALVRAALQGPRPLVETLGAARDHAAAALDRAPRNADALAALGAWYFWAESDWREAGRILARAVEQSAPPSDARAWYAKWLTANGRHDAAIAQAAAIEQRAPVGNAGAPLASALYFARRFEEAAAAAERVLGFHPDSRSALSWLYLASRAAGHDARAVGALERLARVNGRSTEGEPGSLEGRRRAAVLAQLGLVTRVGEQGTHRIAVEGAVLSVEAGNLTDALEWARRAVDRREPAAVLLGVHPALAELHGDRRFVDLVARARRHRGVNSRSYLSPDLIR
jgi:tetratricopeptide (TPR) repeat protein